jgi:hypothetical protein
MKVVRFFKSHTKIYISLFDKNCLQRFEKWLYLNNPSAYTPLKTPKTQHSINTLLVADYIISVTEIEAAIMYQSKE